MDNNYEYTKINTKIGEIKLRKAFALKNTGCFTLCGTFIGTCLINNPTLPTAIVLGADVLLTTYYGIKICIYQRKINDLNEEKNKIKSKLLTN